MNPHLAALIDALAVAEVAAGASGTGSPAGADR